MISRIEQTGFLEVEVTMNPWLETRGGPGWGEGALTCGLPLTFYSG
jgi:hypothetical protein